MTRKVRKTTTKKKPHKHFTQQARRNETNKQLLLRSDTSYNDHYYMNNPLVNNQTPSNIKELRSTIANKPQASNYTTKGKSVKQPQQEEDSLALNSAKYLIALSKRSEQNPSAHWLAMDLIRRSTLHGYFPQQSGNYTNNREYNDLQQQYHSLNAASNMNQVTLQSINKANKQLEETLKEQHQQINDAQKKRNKLQEQLDKNKADLVEGNRVEREAMKLRTNIYHTQEQLNETQSSSNIMQLKNYQASYVEQYNKAKAKNTQLKEELDQNTLYNEINELKQNTEKLVAENEGLQNDINSDEFKHPNKTLTKVYQENLKERDRQELLKKEHDVRMDNIQVEAIVNALAKENPNDETAITEQAKTIAYEQEQIRNQQRKIDQLKHIREKKEKLEDQATDFSIDIKVNDAEANQLKESNEGSINTTASELGKLKAKKFSSNVLVKKRINIANMNDEVTTNNAEANELNSHKSIKESRANRQLGEAKAKYEESTQLLNATKQEVESNRQKEIVQGGTDYYNSKEFNKTDEQIARLSIDAKINDKQRQQIELTNKAQEQAAKSLHQLAVAQNSRGVDMDDTYQEAAIAEQISHSVDVAEKEEEDRVNKQRMIDKISQLAKQRENHSNNWTNFITDENYSKYANFLNTPYAFDIPTMNELYNDFLNYTHKSKFFMPEGFDNQNIVEEEEED